MSDVPFFKSFFPFFSPFSVFFRHRQTFPSDAQAMLRAHPRGVRQQRIDRAIQSAEFQSTHPRGVRPGSLLFCYQLPHVSIHAPAWGATLRRCTQGQHMRRFNPRTRVGCDPAACSLLRPFPMFQSTHPRGVRHMVIIGARPSMGFQSTHPRGVRPIRHHPFHAVSCFNPRTRVGCDRYEDTESEVIECFNPRTRVGCDMASKRFLNHSRVSIHAPAWGAT